EHVESAGLHFLAAPEYPVFPTRERPLGPYEAVVVAAEHTRRRLRESRPDVVVHDILTLAPALAGELEGLPVATLIPHVYPVGRPGLPPYALGARLPRTWLGEAVWRLADRPVQTGLRRGREELNQARGRLGLPPLDRLHGGLSQQLCIVGTFPQLEYPRHWPERVHVVGPLLWEPPYHDVEPPWGAAPLVVVAPSTAQDSQQRLLLAALEGLAAEPVRVLATWNRRPPPVTVRVPPNARLVEWISYSRTMPGSALVICHGGHGTLVRALASGAPVLTVPHSGDMAENAVRAEWAGVGLRLPWRLLRPGSIRLAVRRALTELGLRERASELADWASGHDGATRAAELVEELAGYSSRCERT
ncbi:MAG TPA: nucleotide disphospho-sugar-binding domain-containing protein, partial [Solirubrobacteraceae bacterium]|nr:nucleotide disphospho-sugar-binding domain-containing protein [Solirubrobacteraceae bacterium]